MQDEWYIIKYGVESLHTILRIKTGLHAMFYNIPE